MGATTASLDLYDRVLLLAQKHWPQETCLQTLRDWHVAESKGLSTESHSTELDRLARDCFSPENTFILDNVDAMVQEGDDTLPAEFRIENDATKIANLARVGDGIIQHVTSSGGAVWSDHAARALGFIVKRFPEAQGAKYNYFCQALRAATTLQASLDNYLAACPEGSTIVLDDDNFKLTKAVLGQKVDYDKLFTTLGAKPADVHAFFENMSGVATNRVSEIQEALWTAAHNSWLEKVAGLEMCIYLY